ncbi:hypothetical protein GT045_24785 [Streptomyces sp. SID486]|uniref:hypothetical protein n=1 Tax=Streptomyces sp. SID486 TaxID=2690264 RepID=UPI001372112E|nr:hypothetical protein [Streptomyces sp. SID486]MYW21973.1 hypothetical protein [Streptomyces sp. SID2955]MYX97938.1 hypothetical protein [Streptomyces sp. SID486]
MAGPRRSRTADTAHGRNFLKAHHAARAVFHPVWIPEPLDPAVEQLKRVRIAAGSVAAAGVYTFVEGGFALKEMLENLLIASAVLLVVAPLTVGVMLWIWRRTGSLRPLRPALLRALGLLLTFVGSVVVTVLLLQNNGSLGGSLLIVPMGLLTLWMVWFVGAGALRITGNFFGTAAVHRCLPPLLAVVTSWLMALPDLLTGDLHGLGLGLGVVFILGAPVTVTAIALYEMGRLKRGHGIRLTAHPTAPGSRNPSATGRPYGR